jgi:hypothetical protein
MLTNRQKNQFSHIKIIYLKILSFKIIEKYVFTLKFINLCDLSGIGGRFQLKY